MSLASNSISGWEGPRYMNIKCGCGKRAIIRIFKNTKNKNGLHYSCEDGVCGWLDWYTSSNIVRNAALMEG